MKQRGRKSAASQNVVNLAVVDVRQEKPEPPPHLTPEQKRIWCDVVNSMRTGSFYPATYPLLECYCSHVTSARFIEDLLRKCDFKAEPKKYKALLQMQCAQSGTLAMLATKLRLLPKTNTRAIRQETDTTGRPWSIRRPRPWEDNDNSEPAA